MPRLILLILALASLTAIVSGTSFIQVFTHPGGGTVCLDDTCNVHVGTAGGYSSTQFADPTCGRDHTIRIYDTAGYEDYTETVYMAQNCNAFTRSIFLEPIPATPAPPGSGDIQLFISPGVGMVCRDDVECESSFGEGADTWSVRFSDVTPNEAHTITVSADGFQHYTTQVTIPPGGITNVDITLQPLTSAGSPPGQPLATKAAIPAPLSAVAVLVAGIAILHRRTGQ